eukprot:SAG31_NODE_3741_length_3931_cov_27.802714_3_plen_80_part_00
MLLPFRWTRAVGGDVTIYNFVMVRHIIVMVMVVNLVRQVLTQPAIIKNNAIHQRSVYQQTQERDRTRVYMYTAVVHVPR